MSIIESEGHCKASDYSNITAEICNGCDKAFGLEDVFEALVDRVRKRCYLIHPECWELLEAKLKGGKDGNLPPWAKF
jgi:hypothetical protein